MTAAAPEGLRGLGAKLRAGMAARNGAGRAAGSHVAGPPAAVPVPRASTAAAPAASSAAGLYEIAHEAEEEYRRALAHHGIQRDSIRLVIACHAMTAQLLPAHARELERIMEAGRRPMSEQEVAAWKAELMDAVAGSLVRIEEAHSTVGERAYAGALEGVRGAAAKLVRGQERASAIRLGGWFGGAFMAGAALAAAAVLSAMTWRVSVAGTGLTLTLGQALGWIEVIAANPDPRKALPDSALRTDPKTGDVYWEGVSLWRTRSRPPVGRGK